MASATMYDSTTPFEIPRETSQYIAIYFNGRFAASESEVQAQYPKARIYTIDVLNDAPKQCSILDIETGDATPDDVPGWVDARMDGNPGFICRLYCNLSTWPAVKAKVATLGKAARTHVRYWIANPTGVAHIVPGSDATQYFWGLDYDMSLMNEVTFNA